MYSNEIKCSINPSNLIAPVKINPKFQKNFGNKNIHNSKIHSNNKIQHDNILENSNFLKNTNITTKTPAYIYTKNDIFPSCSNSFIKPLVSPFRYSKNYLNIL